MTWQQRSAEDLVKDAERRKQGKMAPGFTLECRINTRIGDLVTLLMAGGQLKYQNCNTGIDYQHVVEYQGYSFMGRTRDPLPEGILDRDYATAFIPLAMRP